MKGYAPPSLPPVEAVEVVVLRGLDPLPVREYLAAAGVPRVTVRGAAAARIADLWRRLPPGEQARCHVPPFGLRFVAGGEVVCQASVCWTCNNLYGDAGGDSIHYSFDAGDEVSRALLAELRHATEAGAAVDSPADRRAGR